MSPVELLAFESRRWPSFGKKITAARDELGMTVTAYYSALSKAIDDETAIAAYPLLVKRLWRVREHGRSPRYR